MKPVVFDRTLGWLHPAHNCGCGVVIAGAEGFEDLCSRRFLTVLARRLAEEGLPTLQFDYPGRGDAAGDHSEPERVAAWTSSISNAINVLKSEASVSKVLVIGFRLGALLAPIAITGRDDVVGLALLAPPASGKTYVRELIGLSKIVDAALPPTSVHSDFDGVEASGFRTSADTIAELRTLELNKTATSPQGLDLLLMSSKPAPAHEDFARLVSAAGGSVQMETFQGYEHMMTRPTHDAPLAPISVVLSWATKRRQVERSRLQMPVSTLPALAEAGYVEMPQFIGPAPGICGVLCLPETMPAQSKVILLLNAGAIPHIGTARSAVDMARFLARDGIASMRIDLPGLGQSEAYPEKRTPLYDARVSADVIRIVDWLDQYGFKNICVAGLCAGAFQAFHTARRDPRVTELVMVNPLCFSWDSSYALDIELSNIRDNASRPQPADERRDNRPGPVGRRASRVAKSAKRAARFGMETLKTMLLVWKRLVEGSVESWMRELTDRGTRVLIVSSVDDLSIHEIARHFGPGGSRLKQIKGVTTAVIPAANHTLTPLHARLKLNALVRQFLCHRTACIGISSGQHQ